MDMGKRIDHSTPKKITAGASTSGTSGPTGSKTAYKKPKQLPDAPSSPRGDWNPQHGSASTFGINGVGGKD